MLRTDSDHMAMALRLSLDNDGSFALFCFFMVPRPVSLFGMVGG